MTSQARAWHSPETPSTGERKLYGEYLIKAQGEDVVAGIRTPSPISKLSEQMPGIYKELEEIVKKLEDHFRDMQDFEFTIESGKLYMLQTRNGKRTAKAAVEIAIDLANEGMIKKEEALLRVEPDQIVRLLYKQIDPKVKGPADSKRPACFARRGNWQGRVHKRGGKVRQAEGGEDNTGQA